MELTANGGKQALILFDADLPKEWWQQAQGALHIAHASLDPTTAQGPPVTQLPFSYAEIGDHLNKVDGLKGRYIVLPNCSQGGQHTVLNGRQPRRFSADALRRGHLDRNQTIETLNHKNKQRLSGKLEQWCKREIYPIPTSDNPNVRKAVDALARHRRVIRVK